MAQNSAIGTLPKAFIGTALINFLVGALLGGWMASIPAWIPKIGAIHGEINPFGWLTMMIYGMTYAVLSLSTGYRPPRALVGWAHWVIAELGVVVIVASFLLANPVLYRLGLGFQALAPVVFLGNLLSAVAVGKKTGRHFPQDMMGAASALQYLKRSTSCQGADRVGQRGTDAALMLYLVASIWMWFAQGPATILVDYGWIGGTIWSVGLHLLPRMTGAGRIQPRFAAIAQWLWLVAVLLLAFSLAFMPNSAMFAGRLLGVAVMAQVALFLAPLFKQRQTQTGRPLMPVWSKFAWVAALFFALLLGLLLLLGLDPLSLLALHLLFLGFATTLVYGVGYGLFPHLFDGLKVSAGYAWGQLFISSAGVTLMALAFAAYVWPLSGSWPLAGLLVTGGILAALGAYAFVLQWPALALRQH